MNHRDTGARARHRAPVSFNPARMYLWGGLLLILAFGMTLAGITEAYRAGDMAWMWFFIVLCLASVVLYAIVVEGWMYQVGLKGDYTDVNADVNSRHEWDHHQGEN